MKASQKASWGVPGAVASSEGQEFSKLGPKRAFAQILHKVPKNSSGDPFASFLDPQNLHLGTQLGAILALLCFLDGPRSLPDQPKRPPRSNLEPSGLSNLLQASPRGFQHPSKRPPRALRRSVLVGFDRFSIDFRSTNHIVLLHVYIVLLLLYYFTPLLLFCWRGGGVAALLRCA